MFKKIIYCGNNPNNNNFLLLEVNFKHGYNDCDTINVKCHDNIKVNELINLILNESSFIKNKYNNYQLISCHNLTTNDILNMDYTINYNDNDIKKIIFYFN